MEKLAILYIFNIFRLCIPNLPLEPYEFINTVYVLWAYKTEIKTTVKVEYHNINPATGQVNRIMAVGFNKKPYLIYC